MTVNRVQQFHSLRIVVHRCQMQWISTTIVNWNKVYIFKKFFFLKILIKKITCDHDAEALHDLRAIERRACVLVVTNQINFIIVLFSTLISQKLLGF
jgi:hypothetical protein